MQKFLLPLIDGMQAAGWEVTTVCSDGPYVPGMRAAGYRIETVRINRRILTWKHIRTAWHLVRLLRRERFDLLHVHTPVASLLGRVAARLAGVPLVIYTAHGFYFHDEMPAWKYRLFVWLERLAGRWTDFLFTQSTEDAASAVHLGIMPPDKVLAIGNGVRVARFDPGRYERNTIRRELAIPEHALAVGIVGRLVREKGYGEFLRAAESLHKLNPQTYYLIVGERLPSDYDKAIDDELTQAKACLGEHLKLVGMREDVPALLAALDIFCLPSYREGMPRTIIEAMMMGKPVVATNIRGSREEVVPEQTGLLVPTRDAAALAEALARLYRDAALRNRMGEAGRARALGLYDEQHIVQLQLDKIRDLTHLPVQLAAQAVLPEPRPLPRKVLLTGANGFVGQALCARLMAEQIDIVAPLRTAHSSLATAPGLRVVQPYALDAQTDWKGALQDVDCVVHLAALAHQQHSTPQLDQEYQAVNYAGTCHLARQAAAAGVKRFVYVSTIKVNGESTPYRPFTETDAAHPQDAYARTKWQAEQALLHIGQQTGMDIVILRPPLIYGPRVRANFLRMLDWIACDRPLPLAAVHNRRSLLYLGNFTDAVVHCLAHPLAANRIFVISDAEAVSTAELVRRMAKALGVRPHLWRVPLPLLRALGKLTGHAYEIGRLTDSLEIDAGEIQRCLHWHPPYTLDQGLAETARWFKVAQRS